MNIKIYGKDGCERCKEVRKILDQAEYHDHTDLYDHFGLGQVEELIKASGGDLPIIVIKTPVGVLQMRVVDTIRKPCNC